jgi:hypothetical protein
MKTNFKISSTLLLSSFFVTAIQSAQVVQTIHDLTEQNDHILQELKAALKKNDVEKFRELLPQVTSTDLNKTDNAGFNLLHRAVKKDIWYGGKDIKIVRLLLQHHVDPNSVARFDYTPLMIAEEPAIIQLLIDAGANVNAEFVDWSELRHTVTFHSVEKAKLLIRAGARISLPLIQQANFSGKMNFVKLLTLEYLRLIGGSCLQEQEKIKKVFYYTKNIRMAVDEAIKEYGYYVQQQKLVEQEQQLIPVISQIISEYAYDEVPQNLHMATENQ